MRHRHSMSLVVAFAVSSAFALMSTEAQAQARDAVRSGITREHWREVTVPAGTALRLRLQTPVGSDLSRAEEPVRATVISPIVVRGETVIPADSAAAGHVVAARRPGKVKGRGYIAMRFSSLTPRGSSEPYRIATRTWAREAPATKKQDALKIGIPAGAGAVIGGLVGGKKGAGIGAAVGGGAGTGVVLSTRGKEVRVGRGAVLVVRLTEPLTLRLRG